MPLKKEHFWNPKKPEDQTPAQKALAGGCGAVILLIIVLIVIKSITPTAPQTADSANSAEANSHLQQVSQPMPPLPDATVKITAVALSKAFHENEARASQRYSGVPLQVSGKVKSIMLDISGDPMVLLRGSGDVYGAGFTNDGKMSDVRVTGLSKEAASRIDKGQTVEFRCQGVAVFVGSPQLTDCFPL